MVNQGPAFQQSCSVTSQLEQVWPINGYSEIFVHASPSANPQKRKSRTGRCGFRIFKDQADYFG